MKIVTVTYRVRTDSNNEAVSLVGRYMGDVHFIKKCELAMAMGEDPSVELLDVKVESEAERETRRLRSR